MKDLTPLIKTFNALSLEMNGTHIKVGDVPLAYTQPQKNETVAQLGLAPSSIINSLELSAATGTTAAGFAAAETVTLGAATILFLAGLGIGLGIAGVIYYIHKQDDTETMSADESNALIIHSRNLLVAAQLHQEQVSKLNSEVGRLTRLLNQSEEKLEVLSSQNKLLSETLTAFESKCLKLSQNNKKLEQQFKLIYSGYTAVKTALVEANQLIHAADSIFTRSKHMLKDPDLSGWFTTHNQFKQSTSSLSFLNQAKEKLERTKSDLVNTLNHN